MSILQMMAKRYFVSKEFGQYISDWAVFVFLMLEVAIIGEHTKPFSREFRLNDPSIQHPFADQERVPVVLCLVAGLIVPMLVMIGTLVVMHGHDFAGNKDKFKYHLHLINISFLGLCITLAIDIFLIDTLKNWIARPRPDFLARCGPKVPKGADLTKNYDLSICTAPLGEHVLYDGLRSCPSGHSGIAFGGLLYLSLWLAGQLKAFKPRVPIWKLCVAGSPTVLAAYIALSRTQDYRHHFGDIMFGGIIGVIVAIVVYLKYFRSVFDFNKCHAPYSASDESSDWSTPDSTEDNEVLLPV
ncbi:hypothetical protein DASC09_014980 [Saccharomycopsis crataegensis]|uniref:Phosphatidic acid phosphatase type 2/haloperoxidase domain-containing protein n=1 Tax=Saccharomycopsis crataegensis TaxID=43959 RepID=A0AAV5QH43_9ASCO|nr:hypothetical protein DASC09_014980 [Saccharomycopsis crataegensis]